MRSLGDLSEVFNSVLPKSHRFISHFLLCYHTEWSINYIACIQDVMCFSVYCIACFWSVMCSMKNSLTKGFVFFFYLHGCPGQLARTMTNPTAHWTSCKPSEHVRHRGDDRRAQGDSNPGAEEGNKSLPPLGQYLKCKGFV
jgi:hypothetical protein